MQNGRRINYYAHVIFYKYMAEWLLRHAALTTSATDRSLSGSLHRTVDTRWSFPGCKVTRETNTKLVGVRVLWHSILN